MRIRHHRIALFALLAFAVNAGAVQAQDLPVNLWGFAESSVIVPISAPDEYAVSLEEIEIDFTGNVIPGFELRADLNIFPAHGVSWRPEQLLEQLNVSYFSDEDSGFMLAVGKRNAGYGLEAHDRVDMYQSSHGLLFSRATQNDLSGVFAGYVGDGVSVLGWWSNRDGIPWSTALDVVGASLTLGGEAFVASLSGSWGPLPPQTGEIEVLTSNLDLTAELGALTLMSQGFAGRSEDLLALGLMAKANFEIGDMFDLTARWDWLDMPYGPAPFEGMSVTGAVGFSAFFDTFGGGLEYRTDFPVQGDPVHSTSLSLTASF